MGVSVLVYGKSGSGKSRSLKGFGPEEIFLVDTIGKRLPFPGRFRYTVRTDQYPTIKKGLKGMREKGIRCAVIDDAGYLLTNQFMRGHALPKAGSSTFELYNDIGDSFWDLLTFIQSELPDDTVVYILMHEITNDYGDTKLRTIGKLLDEKVCIEGMVTVAVRCLTEGERHWFRTQSDGSDISKSPEGMLPLEMDNDLKAVDTAIRAYWGLDEGRADG